jgi:rhodanese-related sulfurtransferase
MYVHQRCYSMMRKQQFIWVWLVLATLLVASCSRLMVNGQKQPAGAIVLDVRTAEEFAQGHLPKAINYNVLDTVAFQQQINQLQKDKHYIVYCRSGKRSKTAVAKMQAAGFSRITEVDGGIQAYKGKTVKN